MCARLITSLHSCAPCPWTQAVVSTKASQTVRSKLGARAHTLALGRTAAITSSLAATLDAVIEKETWGDEYTVEFKVNAARASVRVRA